MATKQKKQEKQPEIPRAADMIPAPFTMKFDSEAESYVLTPEDELKVLSHSIARARDHEIWKMRNKGLSEMEIKRRIAEIDFIKLIDKAAVLTYANTCKNYEIWILRDKKTNSCNQIPVVLIDD